MKKRINTSRLIIGIIIIWVIGFTFFKINSIDTSSSTSKKEIQNSIIKDSIQKKVKTQQIEKNDQKQNQNTSKNNEKTSDYTIIQESGIEFSKYSFDIRLKKKVSKSELENIAFQLKSRLNNSYDRIFIVYYLPGMELGNGGWATSHFNPNLNVTILGLSQDSESKVLKKYNSKVSNQTIGRWKDETPYFGCIITMYIKNGKIFLRKDFEDGSSGTKEYLKKTIDSKTIYFEKEGNDFGEFIFIDSKGDLKFYDDKGWIYTAQKI